VDATCIRRCFDSTRGRLYEEGKTYDVDENTSFAQANFDVPKKGKDKKDPEKGKDKEDPEKGKDKKDPEKGKDKKDPEKGKDKE